MLMTKTNRLVAAAAQEVASIVSSIVQLLRRNSGDAPAKLVKLRVKLGSGIAPRVREGDGEADGVLKSSGGVLLI